jgi:hypothetical protein
MLFAKQSTKKYFIQYIAMHKAIPLGLIIREILKIQGIAGIGKFIQINGPPIGSDRKNMPDEVGADKTGSAGD